MPIQKFLPYGQENHRTDLSILTIRYDLRPALSINQIPAHMKSITSRGLTSHLFLDNPCPFPA